VGIRLVTLRDCLHCQLVWLRLRSVPGTAGRWGKFLSAILAASWAATLWNNGPRLSELAGEGPIIELLGRHLAAVWMTAVAAIPIIGMASGVVAIRIFAATLGLATWSSLLLEMIFQDGSMRSTMGACLVGILGCLNADIRLAQVMAEKQG
jgi:hypothetical protein